jgi:hypothetical protein
MERHVATSSFNAQARAVQNHMTGNINPHMLPAQLRPVTAEMARNGEPPFALVTMTQQMMHNMRQKSPAQFYWVPTDVAFHRAAAIRQKQF